MINKTDTGGQAFPTHGSRNGMTLRDYFAGLAMQSVVANPEYISKDDNSVAEWAYAVACAMIQEKRRLEETNEPHN